jgi:hypothetical protein
VRTLAAVLIFACSCVNAFAGTPQAPDSQLLQSVLDRYVSANGTINYAELRAGAGELNRFVSQVAAVSPDSNPELFPSKEAKLAYWINAYNALVLSAFSKEYPQRRERLHSLLGRREFFFKLKHTVGGAGRTLDDIEVKSIRKAFNDPRIHFAIVCASKSCPWLSKEAYTAENVNAHLERDATQYFGQARNFRMDIQHHAVYLPQIFDWFKDDFGSTPSKVLAFVARYRPAEAQQLTTGSWKIQYFNYDWSPNDAR